MDWFLYDNGLRHERVNQELTCISIYPEKLLENLAEFYRKTFAHGQK